MSKSVFDRNPPQALSSDIDLDCPSAVGSRPYVIEDCPASSPRIGRSTHAVDRVIYRGRPDAVSIYDRFDAGDVFILATGDDDGASHRVGLAFIPPGEPWRNRYVESFNGRVCDERLNINVFSSLAQARR